LYLSSTHTGEINEKGLWSRMVGDRANILENQIRLLALSYMYNVSDMPNHIPVLRVMQIIAEIICKFQTSIFDLKVVYY
jgi:hypothetical protein